MTANSLSSLTSWNSCEEDDESPAAPDLWPAMFEAQARRTPGEAALVKDGNSIAFRMLDSRANQWARLLIQRGVGPGTVVAIALPRSVEMVVALLAVAKAGGAYLPVVPATPPQRARYMIDNAGVALVLTNRETARAQSLEELGSSTIFIEDRKFSQAVEGYSVISPADSDRIQPLTPRHPAYVLYTSGSTGTPKGVLVSHAALSAYIAWASIFYEAGEGDGATLSTPLSFDASIASLHVPLLAGRPVILLPEVGTVEALADILLSGLDLTLVKLTPSHLEALRLILGPRIVKARARCFVIGGETLPRHTVTFWRENCPGIRLINQYGPTEAAVACVAHVVGDDEDEQGPVPIGRAMAGNEIHILNDELAPVAPGETGELYIGGAQLADGYVGRPDLTAERFVASPFGPPGARLYRTGDLARSRPDGRYEFLGRADRQVKIHGYRIEPEEIEAVIMTHPGVKQAAVNPCVVAGETRLVAYVVSEKGAGAFDPHALGARLTSALPDFMIPASYVELEALPLSGNGKLDRAALPTPETRGAGREHPAIGGVETELCQLFEKLTGAKNVGFDDNFFELGGDSLLGLRLVFEIERKFARKIRFVSVINHPTPRGLTVFLESGMCSDEAISVVPLHTEAEGAPIFLIHWIERDLAAWIGKNRPIYGLTYGLATQNPESLVMPNSIEELAAHYVEQMKIVEPEGPYHIIGHSLGGIVAYEMAVQLAASNESIGFVGLLDSDIPVLAPPRVRISKSQLLRRVVNRPRKDVIKSTELLLASRLKKFPFSNLIFSKHYDTPFLANLRKVNVLAKNYFPKRFSGQLHLFKSTMVELFSAEVPANYWNEVWNSMAAGGVVITEIPGTHMGIVKNPLAKKTAKAIENALAPGAVETTGESRRQPSSAKTPFRPKLGATNASGPSPDGLIASGN